MTPPITSIIPRPNSPITVRLATVDDLSFIDALQKLHTKQVGFLSRQILEANIRDGHVLIAENPAPGENPSPQPSPSEGRGGALGYCIGVDRYFKRDDVGIIYQLNVAPGKQRGLVGATLIKALFERAAYGCRLFCCWCAQDIEANHFWEALGFVPLAYRAGSRPRPRIRPLTTATAQNTSSPIRGGRVHIFWERRIRAGDVTTPYWYPSQTSSGALRENRIVLPIPPGTNWGDAKPLLLPDTSAEEPKQLPGPGSRSRTAKRKVLVAVPTAIVGGGLRFVAEAPAGSVPKAKSPREPKRNPGAGAKVKNDPRWVAAARELKDRWLEKVNSDPTLLESGGRGGKYDVSRPPELPLPPEGRAMAPVAFTPTALLEAA